MGRIGGAGTVTANTCVTAATVAAAQTELEWPMYTIDHDTYTHEVSEEFAPVESWELADFDDLVPVEA